MTESDADPSRGRSLRSGATSRVAAEVGARTVCPLRRRILEAMRLAATAHQRVLAERGGDHHPRHLDAATRQRGGTVVQQRRLLHRDLVPFQVLGAPAAQMRDIRELRELAADLAEEAESWPATACTLSWPPVTMKAATLSFSR